VPRIAKGVDISRADERSSTGSKIGSKIGCYRGLLLEQTAGNLTTKECFFWTPRIAQNISGPRCDQRGPDLVKHIFFQSGILQDPLELFVTVGIERIVDSFEFGLPFGLFNLRTRQKRNRHLGCASGRIRERAKQIVSDCSNR
jgi:hypothetical protein